MECLLLLLLQMMECEKQIVFILWTEKVNVTDLGELGREGKKEVEQRKEKHIERHYMFVFVLVGLSMTPVSCIGHQLIQL